MPTARRRAFNFRFLAIQAPVLFAVVLAACFAFAQAGGGREVTLEQRLTLGLQARRPQEVAFVGAVVDTVNRGELPVRLVDRTFFWARNRTPKQGGKFVRRPIIYFQPALLAQTRRLRIDIRATPTPNP